VPLATGVTGSKTTGPATGVSGTRNGSTSTSTVSSSSVALGSGHREDSHAATLLLGLMLLMAFAIIPLLPM
jgi:hypothetical protein